MEGLSTPPERVPEFRTPVRILLPKLVRSRDNWKDKCQQRRTRNKALTIKIRDLTASRDSWRAKYEALQAEHHTLQIECDQLRAQREARAPEPAPKK